VRLTDATSNKSTLFTITPSGLLEHPDLPDPMPVAGLTIEEITAALAADLKRRAVTDNLKVWVGVREYGSHAILVSGLVKEPGTKIIRREAIPLYVVIADAQPLPEAARLTLARNQSNEFISIELTDTKQMNLLVLPGDVITLHPHEVQFFYVSGEVKAPGEKTFRRGLTLTQALMIAGGVSPKSKEARLARDDGNGFLVVTRYKLKDIDSGKVRDPLLQPGDRITIVE
jgi:protein involved in polysaccharide export with SLBB domain